MKKILVFSDTHCGSVFGLTAPPYQKGIRELGKLQSDFFDAVIRIARKEIGKVDYAFFLGDAIEGLQKKSGGAHLITNDINEQAEIAVTTINHVLASVGYPKVYAVYGTPYHTVLEGGAEMEKIVYDRISNMKEYGDELNLNVNGLIFNLSHAVSSSQSPYGKHTALAKGIVMNTLMSAMDIAQDADMIVHGHVHYCVLAGYPASGKSAITCPCLKLWGESNWRSRQKIIDIGLLLFLVDKVIDVRVYPIKLHYETARRLILCR